VQNRQKFLRDAIQLCSSILDDLEECSNIDSLPKQTIENMDHFYMSYIAKVESDTPPLKDDQMAHSSDEIRRVLQDSSLLGKRMELASNNLQTESQQLMNDWSDKIDLSYIQHLNFRDDPVFQRIHNRLGL
jgi:hypothetical protein